ncbi:glycoside hydrolase [Anaeromyces robustus]|uniref:Glycoside hydrolase n=1 Tax=Anaeromyces robustus TaxID=1754192 RepID=A0A1Y1XGM3_9FUNG|nr:glycoside hydrolase [Anaeromyces robustus]|eukprot:ORX84901.1 glycoside hydrolase [Anaeromyces robustus]
MHFKLNHLLLVLGFVNISLALTTKEFMKSIGMGVNIGHTFDTIRDWSNIDISEINSDFKLWTDSEVKIKEAVEGYKNLGFHSIRIPVKWSTRPTTKTPIEPKLLKAVEEVVRVAIENDMYVIINLETDNFYMNGFISEDKAILTETYDSYKGTWKQIANYFKDYDEHLMFEALNESGYWETIWNTRTADGDRPEALAVLLKVNQEFINTVRSIEGYNQERYLLIEGYACDPILTQDHFYKTPSDPKSSGKLIVSLYYFIPYTFTVIEKYGIWGSSYDVHQLQEVVDDLRYRFVIQGVPVIFTRYGTNIRNRKREDIRSFLTSVANITTTGEIPSFFNDIGALIDRTQVPLSFTDKELGESYLEMGKRFNPKPKTDNDNDNDNDNDDNEKEICFSEPDYPCCSNCDVEIIWNDENKGQSWSIENNNWCGILQSCFKTKTTTTTTTTSDTSNPTSNNCWSLALGYPCCQSSTKVHTTDENGSWGIENNQWCGIPTN